MARTSRKYKRWQVKNPTKTRIDYLEYIRTMSRKKTKSVKRGTQGFALNQVSKSVKKETDWDTSKAMAKRILEEGGYSIRGKGGRIKSLRTAQMKQIRLAARIAVDFLPFRKTVPAKQIGITAALIKKEMPRYGQRGQ